MSGAPIRDRAKDPAAFDRKGRDLVALADLCDRLKAMPRDQTVAIVARTADRPGAEFPLGMTVRALLKEARTARDRCQAQMMLMTWPGEDNPS